MAYDFDHGATFAITDADCASFGGSGNCSFSPYRPVFPDRPEPAHHCRIQYIGRDGHAVTEQLFDEVEPFQDDMAPVRIGDLWGYLDRSGKLLIAPQFTVAAPFDQGVALVSISQEGKYGYIDRTGQYLIPPRYSSAGQFSDGLAPVTLPGSSTSFYIHLDGRRAFAGDFTLATHFVHGLAHVQLQEPKERGGPAPYAYIDRTGRKVFEYFGE